MSDLSFSLATQQDDAGIRALLAANAMPGRIRMRFTREPDYFAGCATMGPFTQVLVAREQERVVGVACRAVRRVYVNGVAEDVGYLAQLRVDPEYRGRLMVHRGFRMLRELHGDARVRGYVTTIVDGNEEAEGVLVRRSRPGMPRYRFLENLITLALPVPPAHPAPESVDALPFLERHGSRRNFFPVWNDDFDPANFVGVDGGVAALWDQSACKQTIIDGENRALRLAYGSFFCTANDDPRVAHALIEKLLALASSRGVEHLLLGFTESDSHLAAARMFPHLEYASRIYTVAFDDGDDLHDRLDSRPRYLELATL